MWGGGGAREKRVHCQRSEKKGRLKIAVFNWIIYKRAYFPGAPPSRATMKANNDRNEITCILQPVFSSLKFFSFSFVE